MIGSAPASRRALIQPNRPVAQEIGAPRKTLNSGESNLGHWKVIRGRLGRLRPTIQQSGRIARSASLAITLRVAVNASIRAGSS